MLFGLTMLTLGLILGYTIRYGVIRSIKAESERHALEVRMLREQMIGIQEQLLDINKTEHTEIYVDTLRNELAQLKAQLLCLKNEREVIVFRLINERNEAREYAEKYLKLYKKLLEQ